MLNLISNSRYALNARYPGFDPHKIIEIACIDKLDGDHPVYRITVKDYGTGLPQSLLERLFEPFFTTKPPGEGTGLGLSISYDIIVRKHRGTLDVYSRAGAGTCFMISFPLEEQ